MLPLTSELTVVTINYNNKLGLERTASSLLSQGADLFSSFEWLVIDGASTDDSLVFVEDLPPDLNLILRSEPDEGIYNAMNKGIRLANNSFCLFLNSGDTFYASNSLRSLLFWLKTNQEHDVYLFGHKKVYPVLIRSRDCASKSFSCIPYGMPTSHQSIVYRTSLLRYHCFDETFPLASDYAHLCVLFKCRYSFCNSNLILSSFYLDGVTTTFSGFWQGLRENHRIRRQILHWNIISVFFFDLCIMIKCIPILLISSFRRA